MGTLISFSKPHVNRLTTIKLKTYPCSTQNHLVYVNIMLKEGASVEFKKQLFSPLTLQLVFPLDTVLGRSYKTCKYKKNPSVTFSSKISPSAIIKIPTLV